MQARMDESEQENVAAGEAPRHLFARIMNRIRAEKKLASAKRCAVCSFAALGGSLAIFLAACFAVQNALVQSELVKIFSLIFSDPAEIVANWQDFGTFVIESLPVAAIIGFLVSLLALLWSAKFTSKYLVETISTQKKIRRQLRIN